MNAAGDILLTAGNDIYVDTITATASRKGKVTASFSADAGGTFSAAGLIDVEADGQGQGLADRRAPASTSPPAMTSSYTASRISPRSSRAARAEIWPQSATSISAGKNVTDTGNVDVQATIAGRVAHSVLADANLLLTAASAAQINGNVTVAALANLSRAGLVSAHALTELGGNNVTVTGAVNVEALANDRGSGKAAASALVSIQGTEIRAFSVFLPTSILARSRIGPAPSGGGGPAKSLADVTIKIPGAGPSYGPDRRIGQCSQLWWSSEGLQRRRGIGQRRSGARLVGRAGWRRRRDGRRLTERIRDREV